MFVRSVTYTVLFCVAVASERVLLGNGTVFTSEVASAYQFSYQVSHPGCMLIATLFDFQGPAFMWASRTVDNLDSPSCLTQASDCQFSIVRSCCCVFNRLSLLFIFLFLCIFFVYYCSFNELNRCRSLWRMTLVRNRS